MLKSLFSGRLARVSYAYVAVPIVLVQLMSLLVVTRAPMFFGEVLHLSVTNAGLCLMALGLVMALLPFILMVASIKRLRDIRLSGWLALPIPLRLAVGFASGVYESQLYMNEAPSIGRPC